MKLNINNYDNIKIIGKFREKKDSKTIKIYFADIETIIVEDTHQVACICLVYGDSNDEYSFTSMKDFFNFVEKNLKDSIIYFHNFGKFDSTFILNWILTTNNIVDDLDIIERNNIIYQLRLKKNNIYFRDSLLLLNMSLQKIGTTFCKNYQKNEFDYDNITNIFNENPELVINQCIQDCKVLKEGFLNFSIIILDKFNIDVKDQLTLPSLALNIFKYHFYHPEVYPITKNPYKTDEFIRRSYKGGVSEVYKPQLKKGFCYDANSLYPSVMSKNKFPVGLGKFVSGSDIDLNDFIGFIECRVSTDKELNFLTFRHPSKGLISPIGEWVDVYYYKEVKFAIKLGYKIDFIQGFKYTCDAYLFKNYVKTLYDLRLNSKDEMKNISKLLLNSLYGRFGMKSFVEKTKFVKEEEIEEMKKNYNITNISYIGNDYYSIKGLKINKDKKDLYKNSIDTETAVQIASAITAESRIFMYKFKNIKDNPCYYTDTDSVFLEKPLEENYIGEYLGQFKLEYTVKEALFIAPKVYYVLKEDNTEKFVVKGMKTKEIDKQALKTSFNDIIKSDNIYVQVERSNSFKRNLIKLIIYIENLFIQFNFPFNKRIKVYKNGIWSNTKPIKIHLVEK